MQQLLLLSAMRPERVTQSIRSFISIVLDQVQKQRSVTSPMGLTRVAKTIRAEQLPMILFRDDPYLSVTKLQQFTSKMKVYA